MKLREKSKIILLLLILTLCLPTNTLLAAPEETQNETNQTDQAPEERPVDVKKDAEGDILQHEINPSQAEKRQIIKTPIDTPASVTGEKYNGSGTVVDFTTTGAKAFYTVKAQDNSIYYIIIDMDKTENNVYFLSEVNGEQLTLNDITQKNKQTNNTPVPKNENEASTNNTKTEPTSQGNSTTFWAILIIGSLAFIGFHLFFGKGKNLNSFLKKKKTEKNNPTIDEENIYYDEELDDEEYLVEDIDDEEE